MKIVILSNARSGSTWLYNTLMNYLAPQQAGEPDGRVYDEVFAKKRNLQHIHSDIEHMLQQPNWVIKVLVEDIHPQAQQQFTDCIRHSDRVVKLVRDPAQITFSRIISKHDQQWGEKSYRLLDIPTVSEDQLRSNVMETIVSCRTLQQFPCDTQIDYADMQFPRQILSMATGWSIERIIPMRDQHHSKNHYEYDHEQWINLGRRIDRMSNQLGEPFPNFLTINARIPYESLDD